MTDATPQPAEPSQPRSRLRALSVGSVTIVAAAATAVFAGFLNENRLEDPDLGAVALWWLATVGVGINLLVVILLRTRTVSAVRVALSIAVGILAFFSFDRVYDTSLEGGAVVGLWLVLSAAAVAFVFLASRYEPVQTFGLLLAILLAVLPLGSYVVFALGDTGPSTEAAEAIDGAPDRSGPTNVDPGELPNVYVFIFDERARNDQLIDVVGYDASEFESQLAELDFSVSASTYAAYNKTIPSLASVFDMDYVATVDEDMVGGITPFSTRLQGHNLFVEQMKDLGYSFVFAEPGTFDWLACDPEVADVCLDPRESGLGWSEANTVLAEMTPVRLFDSEVEPHIDPVHVLDQLGEHADEISEPFVLQAHILTPHGPFKYEESCDLRAEFLKTGGLGDAKRGIYAQDVRCMDALTLEAMKRIVEQDPDAFVVLMSDHGSNFVPQGIVVEEWSDEALRERYGVFDAIRAPGCAGVGGQRGVLVNTLPPLLACLTGTEAELVEPRAFMWRKENPDVLGEVEDPERLLR